MMNENHLVADGPDVALEPFTYNEDFESGELKGWASYPLWQDTAFDPWIRPNTIVPGDPNICLEHQFPIFWNEDAHAGAQKLLDMYLLPNSSISLRFYLATHIPAAFFKVLLAAGPDGKLQYAFKDPPCNRWQPVTIGYDDLARENSTMAARSKVKINAIAVLAKIPRADTKMNYYFGLDDVVVRGARVVPFHFLEPQVHKLSEWKPHISKGHYHRGDEFALRGRWPIGADRVRMKIARFEDRAEPVVTTDLESAADEWHAGPLSLEFPEGLHLVTLTAERDGRIIADTELTFVIAPCDVGGRHPRLWFDGKQIKHVQTRIATPRFKHVADDIATNAAECRKKLPLDDLVFDFDQLPDEKMLEGHIYFVWMDRFMLWRKAVYFNALRYALFGDLEAGEYGRKLLVTVCQFPFWLNPWFRKRGQHNYYPIQEGNHFALGYDLLFDLMDDQERKTIRQGLWKHDIQGAHRSYVESNLITSNTSNWVAMIAGGTLVSQAVIYGDGPDVAQIEPYFTGALLKLDKMIHSSVDADGAYGEGGYVRVSMRAWNASLPIIERLFNIDLSDPIVGIHQESIWSGIIKEKRVFCFGDSGGVGVNVPWLLAKNKDPLLGWAYQHLSGDALEDVLHDTDDVPRKDPYDENPVRLFKNVGTTVFKSGWEKDDFVFVMRSGAFYNHQHLDQGSFWLADHGSEFITERQGSHYWYYSQDPLFLPWFIQPVGHSTILIDGNPQSQRTGDPAAFAPGFEDRAFVYHFLDGTDTAFSSGDIGRVYWGKVKTLRRNVLFLKPRTVLMLDEVAPAERDVDVKLLYQAIHLKDIAADRETSVITKDGKKLYVAHLHPKELKVGAEEVPHYIFTLKEQHPLEREGMLTVSARTVGRPLVIANLLSATKGEALNISVSHGDGHVSGEVCGTAFGFSTQPGTVYEIAGIRTDALAVTWNDQSIFAARCTRLERDRECLVESDQPVTCEVRAGEVKYCVAEPTQLTLGVRGQPEAIEIDGQRTTAFEYDQRRQAIILRVAPGTGGVSF